MDDRGTVVYKGPPLRSPPVAPCPATPRMGTPSHRDSLSVRAAGVAAAVEANRIALSSDPSKRLCGIGAVIRPDKHGLIKVPITSQHLIFQGNRNVPGRPCPPVGPSCTRRHGPSRRSCEPKIASSPLMGMTCAAILSKKLPCSSAASKDPSSAPTPSVVSPVKVNILIDRKGAKSNVAIRRSFDVGPPQPIPIRPTNTSCTAFPPPLVKTLP
jgi:hypothetical protein